MKRFILDFFIAFLIIVGIFGMIGASSNVKNDNFEQVVKDENDDIENIKDYDGNLVNKISFKINNTIQNIADYSFDKLKKIIVAILE